MWFNLSNSLDTPPWFTSRDFRKAICSAIDRTTIVNNVFQGLATKADSMLSSANPVWVNPEIETCRYDPEQSRRTLEKAGFSWRTEENKEVLYDSTGRKVAFELITRSGDPLGMVAAVVQQDLAAIGIDLTIQQEEFRSVISRIMGSRQYDCALLKLDIPDEPTAMNAVMLSSGSMHMWNPGQEAPATEWEADIDKWMEAQASTTNLEKRKEIFNNVQETLADETAVIPLLHNNVLAAWHSQLTNVKPARIFPYTIWNIWELAYSEE
jgi:peptide/nickel transport system substrate-binding protein